MNREIIPKYLLLCLYVWIDFSPQVGGRRSDECKSVRGKGQIDEIPEALQKYLVAAKFTPDNASCIKGN